MASTSTPSVRPVSRRAPGPRGLPLLGSATDLAQRELEFIGKTCDTYGPLSSFRVGRRVIWLVTDPELLDDLLVKRHSMTVKDEITGLLKQVVGEGLLTSEGELWKRQRRLAAPALSRRHVEGYADVMVDCARRFAESAATGVATDLHHDMMEVTLRIVVRTLFGTDTSDEIDTVGAALDRSLFLFDQEIHTWRMFLPQVIPTPSRAEIRAAKQTLEAIIERYVTAKRASGGGGDDLLAMLLSARDEDGTAMDERILRDEIITLFVAGHETTALALTFAQFVLAKNPEAAQKMDAELDAVLGDRPPTIADMARLEYTTAVVKETLRVHPPAWVIGREAVTDLPLGGYVIPKGHQLLVPIFHIHKSATHFPDPEAFVPERWLGRDLERRLPKHAYMPFGGGPRVCIGNHFAMMEAVLVLAAVRQKLVFEPDAGFVPKLRPAVTLRPFGGVPGKYRRKP
ncbi:MAG: cytochrome P450 [Myxococcales bacterium]|nr:cytochrome P450 [Myxococcales bacterium]